MCLLVLIIAFEALLKRLLFESTLNYVSPVVPPLKDVFVLSLSFGFVVVESFTV